MNANATYFDNAAKNYDSSFTNSTIGKRQRNVVRNYVEHLILNNHLEDVLEINCGTGEDAIWLSNFDELQIFATDISTKMIDVAKSKNAIKNNLRFDVADLKNIEAANHWNDYRLVFSNFGGLNCLNKSELKLFLNNIQKILKPHAHLIFVIMPKNTFIEKVYRFFKRESKTYHQRKNENGIEVNVDGTNVKTYFHNSSEIEKLNDNFCCETAIPVGFFPSYFESNVKQFGKVFGLLFKIENFFLKFKRLSNFADHYLIHLKLK